LTDSITKSLNDGGSGFIFVADDPDSHLKIVLKLIHLGPKFSTSRSSQEKMIEKEIKTGVMIAKECKYLVSYSEVFEWKDYFCIKMEYFVNGDIKNELEKGRILTEQV
jgi:serine/threonine protein kinase